MRMKIFNFDESYITRRRKRLSFPDAQCPKILLNSSISRSSRNEPKNAKNYAISLLQMQGCPQSNIKKEIKRFFVSKRH
jgi:hypothetical protein